MCRYDESPADRKPYRQKDGGLLAVGALSDKLKHTDPYKSSLELMLVQHVYPEFNSPAGHLRAKVRLLRLMQFVAESCKLLEEEEFQWITLCKENE